MQGNSDCISHVLQGLFKDAHLKIAAYWTKQESTQMVPVEGVVPFG
jgi:hypothetical protein